MFVFDEDRAIALPPGNPGPPGRLKEPNVLIAGLGAEPMDIANRCSDVVPEGRVFPPLIASPKVPIAEAPIGLELDLPPMAPPGVREDPERAEPPSLSPMRALI